MAIGDDALADGMDLVSGTAQANTIDTEINKTRDYIVQRIVAKIAALWPLPINKGGTGQTTAAGALAALSAWGNSGAVAPGQVPRIGWNGARLQYDVPGYASGQIANLTDIPSGSTAYDGYLNPAIYGRGVVGSWRSLAIQSDGTLAHTASARRFKTEIAPLDITDEQLAQLELVEFDWIADGSHDVGLIADDVAEVLPWAVFHDDNGLVLGIHYERLALALLPTVQRLVERVTELEQK